MTTFNFSISTLFGFPAIVLIETAGTTIVFPNEPVYAALE
jgi:hypothetical protein